MSYQNRFSEDCAGHVMYDGVTVGTRDSCDVSMQLAGMARAIDKLANGCKIKFDELREARSVYAKLSAAKMLPNVRLVDLEATYGR